MLALLLGLTSSVPAAFAAAAAPSPHPGIRLVYGYEPGGPESITVDTPEYQDSRYSGPLVSVTAVNTGNVPLRMTGLGISSAAGPASTWSSCSATTPLIPVGGHISCAWYVSAPTGRPGDTIESFSEVVATSSTETVSDRAPLRWRIHNIDPIRWLDYTTTRTDLVTSGSLVTFRVDKGHAAPWVPSGTLVSMRSERFGNLFVPSQGAVVANDCPASRDTESCTFTARVVGPAGVFTDRVHFVLTDGTGPPVDHVREVSLQIAARPGVRIVFGADESGKDALTVPVPATDGDRGRSVAVTVLNTSPGPLTVSELRVAERTLTPEACAGSRIIAGGGHLTCRVEIVVAPVGTAEKTSPFRAFVRGTSDGVRVEDEALGRWTFAEKVS